MSSFSMHILPKKEAFYEKLFQLTPLLELLEYESLKLLDLTVLFMQMRRPVRLSMQIIILLSMRIQ